MTLVIPSQIVGTIKEFFPSVSQGEYLQFSISHLPHLKGISNLAKQVPQELLILNYQDYADFVWSIGALDSQISIWIAQGDVAISKSKFDPITKLYQLLNKCPDEFPSTKDALLFFIDDKDIRDNIGKDIGATNRALHNAEWKAATVLAGATIEALLLWRLIKHPFNNVKSAAIYAGVKDKELKNQIDEWKFYVLIKASEQLQFIKKDTAQLVELAKNYRNLIHPGRAARLSMICDRGTALSAVGALEGVIRDLS